MHSVSFLFAYLVCASVGRRAQSPLSRSQGSHAVASQKPIRSIDVTSSSQSNRQLNKRGFLHPLRDLADLLRAPHLAVAFQPTTGGRTLASQVYHVPACRLPRSSRCFYLQEGDRNWKGTPQQKLLNELQAASKAYRSNEEPKSEAVSSRRSVFGPLGVALGAVLGYAFSSKQTTESTSKEQAIKSELATIQTRISREDAKLKERPSSAKVQQNNRDEELKETQRRLEETEALWSLAVAAATNTDNELKKKDQLLAGLGIVGVVQAVVMKQNMDIAAEATSKLEAAKEAKKFTFENVATRFEAAMSKEAALYTEALAAKNQLEAAEAEKREALEKAEAELEAAVMSSEAALQEVTSEATKKLEAAESAKEKALKNAASIAFELKAAVKNARKAASAKQEASAASRKAAVEVAELETAAKSVMQDFAEVAGLETVAKSEMQDVAEVAGLETVAKSENQEVTAEDAKDAAAKKEQTWLEKRRHAMRENFKLRHTK